MTMAMATAPAVNTIASGPWIRAAVTGGGAIATASNTKPRRSSMLFPVLALTRLGAGACWGQQAPGCPLISRRLVQSALASLWMVATPPPVGCQNPRDVPGGPRPAKSWRRQASSIERPRQHGLRLQAAPFEPADHPHGFFGTPGVKRGAGVHHRRRMLTPMPPPEKVKLMGIPA